MTDHVESLEPYIMKSHKVLFLVLIVSAALALSAQAGNRHGNSGNSQRGPVPGRVSAPMMHSSSGFRSGGNRMFAPSPRMTMRSNTFSQPRTFSGGNAPIVQRQFTPRTFTGRTGND